MRMGLSMYYIGTDDDGVTGWWDGGWNGNKDEFCRICLLFRILRDITMDINKTVECRTASICMMLSYSQVGSQK